MLPELVKPFVSSSELFYLFILFLAVLGLCCFMGFSLVAASRGYSLVVGLGLLIAVASLVENALQGAQA